MKLEDSEKLLVEELYFVSRKENSLPSLIEVNKLTGDASSRRYYRLNTSSEGFVVCLDEPRDCDSDFFVVQRLLNSSGVKVPEILDYKRDKGYFLEEDLGDETFLSRVGQSSNEEIEALYKKSIDELLKMQNIDLVSANDVVVSNRKFDVEKLMFEVHFSNDYFLNHYLGYSLTEDIVSTIQSNFLQICSYLESRVRVFCHRDYHSRNLMIKNDELFIIDFQDARMGTITYDLVSLLDDCYFSVKNDTVNRLKKYYKEQALSQGICDKEWINEFEKEYDLQLVQRAYKAIGSFSYIYKTRNDVRYLKYIGFAFEKIRHTLNKYPEYEELRKILCELYYES